MKKSIVCSFIETKKLNGTKKTFSDHMNSSQFLQKTLTSPQIFFFLLNNTNIYRPTKPYNIVNLYESFKIDNIGLSYIKISCFYRNFNHIEYLKIEVRPANSKTRNYKFVISCNEIRNYINPKFNFEKNDDNLLQINSELLKNLSLKQENLYRKLCVPFKKISQSSGRKFEDLKMIPPSINPKKTAGVSNEISCVSPYFNAYRVIFQKVKKINKLFAILTVKKHNVFDYWTITVNIPKTARNYSCCLFKSDLIGLSQNFFEETYPIQMIELKKIFEKKYEVDYHKFSLKYENLMKTGKEITKKTSILLKKPRKSPSDHEKNPKLWKFSLKRYMSFVEYKVFFYFL